ncbi:MAG: hypothetical protein Kow00109_26970 [Acidobacteriota bacterium]
MKMKTSCLTNGSKSKVTPELEWEMSRIQVVTAALAVVVLCFPGGSFAAASAGEPAQSPAATETVYVAPNVVQAKDLNVFTTFAITNATPFWFNPRIYLVNQDGEVVRQFAPLLKGFGTWQRTTLDLIDSDFQGSIWIVSPQPIVASAFLHQLRDGRELQLLGNTELRRMDGEVAETALQQLTAAR